MKRAAKKRSTENRAAKKRAAIAKTLDLPLNGDRKKYVDIGNKGLNKRDIENKGFSSDELIPPQVLVVKSERRSLRLRPPEIELCPTLLVYQMGQKLNASDFRCALCDLGAQGLDNFLGPASVCPGRNAGLFMVPGP